MKKNRISPGIRGILRFSFSPQQRRYSDQFTLNHEAQQK